MPSGTEDGIDRLGKEVVILEVKQHAEVDGHGGELRGAAQLIPGYGGREPVEPVVDKHAGDDEDEVFGRVRAVEPQRHAEKEYERGALPAGAVEQKIARQTQRQKAEHEYV